MAKENNEISDVVKKCKILLLDIEGTTTSISFVKDKLFPYAEENVKTFLESHWEEVDVKDAVAALRKQADEDKEKSVEGVVTIPGEDAGKDEQIDGLVKSVLWQMSNDRKAGALKQLQGLIWKLGYDNGDIKGHVYDDVSPALDLWRSVEGQKVYIYSSGSVQAQKLLFAKSLAGDMLPLIEGHFDTAVGAKQEAASYLAIAEKIGSKPEEILFLTDIVKEAEAARASGLQAALVSREGNASLPEPVLFPVLHSFDQLAVTNKRKPDAQVEEVPAKVPKTDVKDDVKTASETEAESPQTNGGTETAEAMETAVEKPDEKMDVEEPADIAHTLTKTEVSVDKVPDIANAEVNNGEKDVPMTDAAETVPPAVDTEVSVDDAKVDSIAEVSVVAETKDALPESKVVETPLVDTPTESIEMSADSKTVEPLVVESKAEDGPVADSKVETIVEEAMPVDTSIEETKAATISAEPTSEKDTFKKSEKVEEPVVAEIPEVVHAESKTEDAQTVEPDNVVVADAAEVTVADTSVAKEVYSSEAKAEATDAPTLESDDTKGDVAITENDVPEAIVAGANATNDSAEKTDEMIVETAIKDVKNEKDDAPVVEIEPILEENSEKTDSETEKMETDVNNIETVIEPKETAEIKESSPVTSIITEVRDITDDKESLNEVTDIIEDLVPIVEEPSQLEEMEELQNAGDVLEKECDEILSKVQDVTSLDYMPVKPLHTIAEEMETENIDSNDIVDRILDTEMELNMKPCENDDLNVVKEVNEPKTDVEVNIAKPNVAEESAAEKMELSSSTEKSKNNEKVESDINNSGTDETKIEKAEDLMEVADPTPDVDPVKKAEVNTEPEESKTESDVPATEPAPNTEETTPENSGSAEPLATPNETKDQDTKKNAAEPKLNGNTTNGNAPVKLNGDSSNDELQSRLSVENGKEKVNGSNGDSVDGEIGQGDNKVESEIPDIKVKTVIDEPRPNPTEQPVEA